MTAGLTINLPAVSNGGDVNFLSSIIDAKDNPVSTDSYSPRNFSPFQFGYTGWAGVFLKGINFFSDFLVVFAGKFLQIFLSGGMKSDGVFQRVMPRLESSIVKTLSAGIRGPWLRMEDRMESKISSRSSSSLFGKSLQTSLQRESSSNWRIWPKMASTFFDGAVTAMF